MVGLAGGRLSRLGRVLRRGEDVEPPTHSLCAEKLERSGRMMSIVSEKEVVALRSFQIIMDGLSC